MAYSIEFTNQYVKDLKLARKRGLDESLLNNIIRKLVEGVPLPVYNNDHVLKGDYGGKRECHISPDWLLIYEKAETLKIIKLIRTGSHSDLFKK